MYNRYMFEDLFPTKLYHSYIVEGDPTTTPFELRDYLISSGRINSDSPDVFFELYEALDMDQSHGIREWHTLASSSGSSRVCIIGAKNINREAEQSLLKMLEEPGENTHFFLVIPDKSNVLPTILSRCHVVQAEKKDKYGSWVDKFISASIKDRLDMVALVVKSAEDADTSATLRHEALNILNSLEGKIFIKYKQDIIKNKNLEWVVGEIIKSKKYLRNPGSSVKMLLEHIALVI